MIGGGGTGRRKMRRQTLETQIFSDTIRKTFKRGGVLHVESAINLKGG